MSGPFRLGLLYALRHRAQTLVVMICISATVGLPVAAELVLGHYERQLSRRAESIPLVAGAKGSRFDLAFAALYFKEQPIEPVKMRLFSQIADDPNVTAVPVHLRFTAKRKPIVAVGADYFDLRGLRPETGTFPLMLGDAVLGAQAAKDLELSVGDSLFSDQRELYDLSVPPPLKMRIIGVLAPTASADDHVVFTGIETAWVLEGEYHGHVDSEEIDTSLVMARTADHVAVSPSMAEYNEITDENIASFHAHGDPELLPITGVMIFPDDTKARTIIRARINNQGEYQAIDPGELVNELFEVVFRVKVVFDWLIVLMAGVTILMITLVSLLATRLRADELSTLARIGASRSYLVVLVSVQLAISISLGVALGLGGAFATLLVLKDLIYTM
jgi:putative ABC transport system permease protein